MPGLCMSKRTAQPPFSADVLTTGARPCLWKTAIIYGSNVYDVAVPCTSPELQVVGRIIRKSFPGGLPQTLSWESVFQIALLSLGFLE